MSALLAPRLMLPNPVPSADPVRVCFMIDRLTRAGTESQLVALIRALDRRKVQASLVLLDGEDDLSRALEPTDELCLGYVFYAPPRAVPRAGRFPTGPVSPDAVLLTSLGVESSQGGADLPGTLIAAVAGDLVRRGVRALEAFGRTAEVSELSDPMSVPSDVAPVMEALGDCSVEQCVLDADLLLDAGFVVVSHHTYFPRLRLELEQGLGWKADVEAALERLLQSAQLQQPVGAGANPCS